jgi:hypothetical protein
VSGRRKWALCRHRGELADALPTGPLRMLPRRCRQHWTNKWKSGHSTVLSSGERMPAVLRSPLSGTRRDVETPFRQESLFAERTTQQKLIATTQNERPFAYEQSPPAVITGERLLAPDRDSPGEHAIEATLVELTLGERRALLLLALWRGRPRPPGNEAFPASTSAIVHDSFSLVSFTIRCRRRRAFKHRAEILREGD